MRNQGKLWIIGLAALALSACTGHQLDNARAVTPQGSPFLNALYQGYVDRAGAEWDEGDYKDSDYFAIRALTAASGQMVLPTDMSERNIPEEHVGEMTSARNRLLTALNNGAREKVPELTARAQVCFDCWMQEQEENFQPDDISGCRDDFLDKMAQIEDALRPPAVEPPPPPPPLPGPYTILFDFDSDAITSTAQADIDRIAADFAAHSPGGVNLAGHTDRAGGDDYNIALSQRRADSVEAALVAKGIPAGAISKERFGESQPRVPTPDGQREAANRRVEVSFSR